MKKIFFVSTILFAVGLSNQVFAQNVKEEKKETIIIQDNEPQSGTTIEIRNGEVFIDGKKVTEGVTDKNKSIKIIKKRNGFDVDSFDEEEGQAFQMPFDGLASDRPMLGVSTKPTETNDGALVESVVPNSPASKLGLQQGDVITKVNTKNILNPKDLVDAIGEFKAGDNVEVTFERNSQMFTKNVMLSERSNSMTFQRSMPFGDDFFKHFEFNMPFGGEGDNPFTNMNPYKSNSPKIGVGVEDRADGEGVFVTDVTENSAAQKAGIQKEDVITKFNSKTITSVDELLEAITASQGKDKVNVEVKRNGNTKNLQLIIPKNLKKRQL